MIIYKQHDSIDSYEALRNDYLCGSYKRGDFIVKTGKPSDNSCLSWHYKTEFEAIATATEFFTNFLKSINYLRV